MPRLIDADALIEIMVERKRPEDGADSSKERYRYIQWLADYWAVKNAPTIKTKQVKYYDEEEKVWKIGRVIVDGKEQTMSEDKAIHTLYEKLKTGNFMCVVPYGDKGRYATYYAEDRLYLVFDLWYHGLFLVEAKSPRDAIDQVNCDRLAYVPKDEGADDVEDSMR